MAEEKEITFNEIVELLEKHEIDYCSLMFGRQPSALDGTRVLYIMSNLVGMPELRVAREMFWSEYQINIQVIIPENSLYVDRSYDWINQKLTPSANASAIL